MQPNSAEINNIAGGSSLPQPPSMEELLASIRRIISEESSGKGKSSEPNAAPIHNEFDVNYDSGMPQTLPDAPTLHADPRYELSRSPMNANDPWAVEETEALVLSSSMMEPMAGGKSGANRGEIYGNGQFMPGGRREPQLDHFPKAINPSPNLGGVPSPAMDSGPRFTETAKAMSVAPSEAARDLAPNLSTNALPKITPDPHFSEHHDESHAKLDGLSALDVGFSSTIADSDFFGTNPDDHARAVKLNSLAKAKNTGVPSAPIEMNGQSQANGQADDVILLSKLATDNSSSTNRASPLDGIDLSLKSPAKAGNLSFAADGIGKSKPAMDIQFGDLSNKSAKNGAAAKSPFEVDSPSTPNTKPPSPSKSAFALDFGPSLSVSSAQESPEIETESTSEETEFNDPFATHHNTEMPLELGAADQIHNDVFSVGDIGIKSGAIGSPDMVMMPSAIATNDVLDELHLTSQDVPPISAPLDPSRATSPMRLREHAPDPLMQAATIGMESVPASTLGYDEGASVMSVHAIDAAARAFAKLQNVGNGDFERTARSEYINDHARRGITVEEMVMDALKPAMQEWLDLNLPRIVELMVKDEIKRVSPRKK